MRILPKKILKIRKQLFPYLLGAVVVLVPLIYLTIRSAATAEAAIIHWSFDDGDASTVEDSSGNSNSGTITSAQRVNDSNCKYGQCLYFDGSSYVSISDTPDLDFAGADSFTFFGWFATDTVAATQVIMAKYETTGADGGYKVLMESDGNITCAIDSDNTGFPSDSATSTGSGYDDRSWHHFACVKDASSSLTLYVDGVQVAQDTSITSSTLANDDTFYVGIDGDGSSNGWVGYLDEIKIHREVRTLSQIKADFNSYGTVEGASASFSDRGNDYAFLEDGLLAYYTMDELDWDQNPGEVQDYSGSGNHATSSGTAPATVVGKHDRSADFDGETYIQTSTNLVDDDDGTIAFWFKTEYVGANIQCLFNASTLASSACYNSANPDISIVLAPNENYIYVVHNAGSAGLRVSSEPLDTDVWYHAVLTWESNLSTVTEKLYVDGVMVDEFSDDNVANLTWQNFNRIGRSMNNLTPRFFIGEMDEFRIYNRALNAREVDALYRYVPKGPAPVAHYKFDENTGTSKVVDSSKNRNDGTPSSNMSESDWVIGKYGSALNMDGTSDYIEIADNDSLDFEDTDFTLMTWMKLATYSASADVQTILMKKEADGATADQYSNYNFYAQSGAGCADNNNISLRTGDTATSVISCSNGEITDTNWHHIAVTYNASTQETTFYIDGVFDSTQTHTATFGANTSPLFIGKHASTSSTGDKFFGGYLDDIKIYDYARTAQQIREDMNSVRPSTSVNSEVLIGYWGFDEGAGGKAYDRSNSGLVADMEGVCPGDATCPTWSTTGKVGGSMYFDDGDSLLIDDGSLFSTSTYTVSAWVNRTSVSSGDFDYIFDTREADNDGYLMTISNSTGLFQCSYNTVDLYSTSTSAIDTWYHVACVSDGYTLKIYVNGIEEGSAALSDTISESGSATIGSRSIVSYENEFIGYIDELKVYNVALSANEILTDMNGGGQASLGVLGAREVTLGVDGTMPSPVLYAPLDENTGPYLAFDSSSNRNNGSLQGSMVNDNIVTGYIGQALDFDGTDDRVQIDSAAGLGTTSSSITAWVYLVDTSRKGVFVKVGTGSNGYAIGVGGSTYGDNGNDLILLFDSVRWIDTNTTIGTGWHHIAMTINSSGIPSAYIDGSFVNSYSGSTPLTPSARIDIGGYTTSSRFFDGIVDEVKVFDSELSSGDVSSEHSSGSLTNYSGYWPLNANGNLSVADTSGNNLSGAFTGISTSQWTRGKKGSALNFDGVNDVITFNPGPSLSTTNTTITAWVFLEDTSRHGQFVNVGTASNGYAIGVGASQHDNNGNDLIMLYDNQRWIDTNVQIGTGWHHVAMVIDGSGQPSAYIDGVYIGYFSGNTPASPSAIVDIGGNSNYSGRFFDGIVDEVKVYNAALSASQINLDYNRGKPLAYWKFDTCSGSTAYDSSGNGINGSISAGGTSGLNDSVGSCNSGNGDEMWDNGSIGKFDSSLHFDGTDDFVNFGPVTRLQRGLDSISVCAWINPDAVTGTRTIARKLESSTTGQFLLRLNASEIEFGVRTSAGYTSITTTTDPVVAGSWQHVCGVYGSGTYSIYYAGDVVISDSKTGTLDTDADSLTLGCHYAGNTSCSGSEEFIGKIDDVRIYSYNLSPTQIETIMNQGAAVRFSN